jgi:hypothetical protein
MGSPSLFVDDEGWEPVADEDEDLEEDARLGWDHSAETVSGIDGSLHCAMLTFQNPSTLHMSRMEDQGTEQSDRHRQPAGTSSFLEPTQKLSDVKNLALFPD